MFALDHYAPAPSRETTRLHARLHEFAAAQGIEVYEIGEGIGHQIIVESGRAVPGALVVAADSHAVTYGAMNCFGTGIGSSDLAAIMITGKMWLRVPESKGRARVFGDDINTDYIITSRRKRESLDPQVLRRYLFEEIDPTFAGTVEPGDLIVAGKNFGCGSAMEVAVTAVLGAGIRAVLAKSFSRTYYRNAVNNGLLPLMCDTSRIGESDRLATDGPTVRNVTTGETIIAGEFPKIMMEILESGGLVPYIRKYGDFRI